jgi:hypothetical protein
VALSLTVMGGFLATDRHVLLVRHRVLLQTTHGLTAVLALSCLAIHIALKVAEAHASVFDVFVPFLSPHRRFFVGLGTIAFYLLIFLTWTGLTRARFAYSPKPWLWRAMHVVAYPTWLLAIVHGLGSGRPAAGWVTASYVLCLVAVALGLLIRVGVARGRRGSPHTTGSFRPVPAQAAYFDVSTAAAPPVAPRRPAAGQPAAPPAMPPRAPVPTSPAPSRVPMPPPAAVAPPRPRRADPRVPPPPYRSMEDVSDDEFWEHMKGDTRR